MPMHNHNSAASKVFAYRYEEVASSLVHSIGYIMERYKGQLPYNVLYYQGDNLDHIRRILDAIRHKPEMQVPLKQFIDGDNHLRGLLKDHGQDMLNAPPAPRADRPLVKADRDLSISQAYNYGYDGLVSVLTKSDLLFHSYITRLLSDRAVVDLRAGRNKWEAAGAVVKSALEPNAIDLRAALLHFVKSKGMSTMNILTPAAKAVRTQLVS